MEREDVINVKRLNRFKTFIRLHRMADIVTVVNYAIDYLALETGLLSGLGANAKNVDLPTPTLLSLT